MRFYITLISLLALFSCKKEVVKNNPEKKQEHYTSYSSSKASWDLYFPDTVYVNEKYNGKIIYKGVLDTLTTSFADEKKSRYIRFMMTTSDKLNIDFKTLKKIAKDTFGALNYRTIPFYDVQFKKLGKNYIHGYINDHAIIDTFSRPTTDNDLMRYVENEISANCAVYVIKRKN